MSAFFRDYHAAHAEAVKLANLLGRETGLEKWTEYGRPGFRVFSLPGPAFRTGFELRCQTVQPGTPLSARDLATVTITSKES